MSPGPLEAAFRAKRAAGRKLLVPYVTGGLRRLARRRARRRGRRGADAIEIGIPFSDPVMDGPVIQEASQRALEAGATPVSDPRRGARRSTSSPARRDDVLQPRCSTPATSASPRRCGAPASSACILPDLPLEEIGPWCEAADAAGVETVMLAAPTAPDERLPRVCARARGLRLRRRLLGVTGERDALATTAAGAGAPAEGGHRRAGAPRRGHVERRAGAPRPCRSPTA